MSDIKTKPTHAAPEEFIAGVEHEQRRTDSRELLALMKDVTGEPPKMWGPSIVGFGRYRYQYASGREGEMCLTGFSPRKQSLVLYLGPGLDNTALLAKLGKHKRGEGCLYINKLDDVDREVLRELVASSVAEMRKRHGE
jgi:Domain of unknown function (DU1801)